jgi:hypothetical protein
MVKTCSEVHSASISVGIESYFPGVKQSKRETEYSSLSSSETRMPAPLRHIASCSGVRAP